MLHAPFDMAPDHRSTMQYLLGLPLLGDCLADGTDAELEDEEPGDEDNS